ncbi:MAG TPA: YggS family pyridoxal phosphate-dependent enzyme [Vicinamibacterales bacterium]|nr:YggS family pyridoxal phosphate-dependent enzyme [Vicinamibacterales bacterium]
MIAANLQDVRRRIDAAAQRSGRPASSIRLIAVSKTFSADHVREAHAAGQIDFGENKVQEGLAKAAELAGSGIRWHLIGHLQSNKAKKAPAVFSAIHSVDSVELLQRIDAAAAEAGAAPEILIQADLAREATKFGAYAADIPAIAEAALACRAARLTGLMLVPPWSENPEDVRPWFRQLRELRDGLVAGGVPAASLAELSMGMSHDFEAAIEEGSTIVRVGTAIFGRRAKPPAA